MTDSAEILARCAANGPLLLPWLVCSCGTHEPPIEGCDGVAVFALTAEDATELGRPYLEERDLAHAEPAPSLEPLAPWGPVVSYQDPRRRVRLAFRAIGWGTEGEEACASCLLYACDLPDYEPCADCENCPECGCAEDCARRDLAPANVTLEPPWDVWVGPGPEPGTGRMFAAATWRNPFRPEGGSLKQIEAADRDFARALSEPDSTTAQRARSALRGMRLGTADKAHGLILARVAEGVALDDLLRDLVHVHIAWKARWLGPEASS